MQTAKKCPKISPPPLVLVDEDLLNFNDLPCLTWSCLSIFDFWSLRLATVKTAETPFRKLE